MKVDERGKDVFCHSREGGNPLLDKFPPSRERQYQNDIELA
jgi:hypothetical protein